MATDTQIKDTTAAVIDAAVTPAKAAADTAKIVADTAKAATDKAIAAKPAARKTKRTVAKRRVAKTGARKAPAKTASAAKKTSKRTAKALPTKTPVRRSAKAATAATATLFKRTNPMTNDFTQLFAGFQLPGNDKFQGMFADAGARGQELAAKSQAATEQFADLAKANVEALVEAGRIAAAGAKSIGQDVLASSRDGIEQASDAVKTLADAKSPTEFFQLQSELVRSSFDRFVSGSSKLTEQVVKLAGEAVQPISNRASVNAARINELVA